MTDPLNVHKTTATVVDFLEWQRQGSLDLSPFYQRRPVWNPRVKSLLIDSLLRGFPIPLIFLHSRLDVATSKTVRQVVDGQQRLRTILGYIDIDCLDEPDDWDRFTVLKSHNSEFAGLAFSQIPDDYQARILQTSLSINVLPADISDVTILSVFQRMNSTGLKLNAQEIRNAKFFGEFKDSAYKLAYEQNQRWQDWGIFTRQQIAQMKEVEFAADLMGFLIHGVRAKTDSAITALFNEFEEDFPMRQSIEDGFRDTFERLSSVYGALSSRSGIKRFRTTAWFYAVFVVVATTPGVTPSDLVRALERGESILRDRAIDDEELLKVLRGATADKRSREARIRFIKSMMR